MQILIARFKQQIATIIAAFLKKTYTMKNARKNRESRKYAQKKI